MNLPPQQIIMKIIKIHQWKKTLEKLKMYLNPLLVCRQLLKK